MGLAAFGQCFATASDAADYAFSTADIAVTSGGYTGFEYRTPDQWKLVTYSGGVEVSAVDVFDPIYPECTPGATVVDGIALGFLVVTVWAVTFAISNLRRAM